jgi:MFS family permease
VKLETAGTGAADFRLLARLSLVLFAPLTGLAQIGLGPILPELGRHFASQPQAEILVRMLVTSGSFAMIFGCLASGVLAEWLGARRLLLWSLAVFGLAGSAGYLVDNLFVLLITRVFLGAAAAIAGVMVIFFITSRFSPATTNMWLGYYSVAGSFGTIALLWVVGILGGIDWRYVFLLHLAALPVLLLILSCVPQDVRPLPVASAPTASGLGGTPLGSLMLGVACGIVVLTANIFLPFHLASIGSGAPERISLVMIPGTVLGGFLAMGYGWVRKFLGIVPVFVVLFALMGIGLMIVVVTGTFAGALTGMTLMACGGGPLFANLFAAAASSSLPERRARTLGFVRAVYYGAPLLAQIPLEAVALRYGPGGAMLALSLFTFAMIAALLLKSRFFVPVA